MERSSTIFWAEGMFQAELVSLKPGLDKENIRQLSITLLVSGQSSVDLHASLLPMLNNQVHVQLSGFSRQLDLWDLLPIKGERALAYVKGDEVMDNPPD